ncbi:atherin-like [Cervus canadensis]|uniref:atherin-like n=1 Tax=Cervus canadensis TaxID=1574408 RepID=UPI001C9E28DA|nr:atherin-like [Cervus canadensis]
MAERFEFIGFVRPGRGTELGEPHPPPPGVLRSECSHTVSAAIVEPPEEVQGDAQEHRLEPDCLGAKLGYAPSKLDKSKQSKTEEQRKSRGQQAKETVTWPAKGRAAPALDSRLPRHARPPPGTPAPKPTPRAPPPPRPGRGATTAGRRRARATRRLTSPGCATPSMEERNGIGKMSACRRNRGPGVADSKAAAFRRQWPGTSVAVRQLRLQPSTAGDTGAF